MSKNYLKKKRKIVHRDLLMCVYVLLKCDEIVQKENRSHCCMLLKAEEQKYFCSKLSQTTEWILMKLKINIGCNIGCDYPMEAV